MSSILAAFTATGISPQRAEDLAYQAEQLVERYGISVEQAIDSVLKKCYEYRKRDNVAGGTGQEIEKLEKGIDPLDSILITSSLKTFK